MESRHGWDERRYMLVWGLGGGGVGNDARSKAEEGRRAKHPGMADF